jgi:hypothetical protein
VKVKFNIKNIEEIENEIFQLAKTLNISCEEISLEELYKLPQYAIKYDNEHNYKRFISAYKIGNEQYFLLFGNKKGNVVDFKWLGWDVTNISDEFIKILHKIEL